MSIMQNVMMKAQELALAVKATGLYERVHELEERVTADPDATMAISNYMEKRTEMETLMRSPGMDPSELSEAANALTMAETFMNDNDLVKEMREAQQKYQDMMENINRILRLVVTGVVEDGCSGNCASCSGCGGAQ